MKCRPSITSLFAPCVAVLFACVLIGVAQAGTIETIPVEDKGVSAPPLGIITFPNRVQISNSMFGPSVTVTLWSAEIVNVTSVGPAVRVFNIYPDTLHVPQTPAFDPNAPIDMFFFMAADTDTTITVPPSGLGPLPSGWTLVDASLTGSTGKQYTAEITPISDLSNLPTSSPNMTAIEWDLSALDVKTGNFYLAKVTLPNAWEIHPTPIPTLPTWALVLLGVLLAGVAVAFIRRRRGKLA